jgi:hypothetical protein
MDPDGFLLSPCQQISGTVAQCLTAVLAQRLLSEVDPRVVMVHS